MRRVLVGVGSAAVLLTGCGDGGEAKADACAEAKASSAEHRTAALEGSALADRLKAEQERLKNDPANGTSQYGIPLVPPRVYEAQHEEDAANAKARSELRLMAEVRLGDEQCFSVEERAQAREILAKVK